MIKKLLYISPRDMRKNRSDAVHIMHSCAAFAHIGIDVTLITPKVERKDYNIEFSQIFDLYNMSPDFDIIELPTQFLENTVNKDTSSKLAYQKFKEFAKFALKNRRSFPYEMVYSKCFISSLPFLILKRLGMLKTTFVFEAPHLKQSRLHNFIVRHSDYIVVGSSFLEKSLKSKTHIANKVIKTPRRYYFDAKETNVSKPQLRELFKFKDNRTYVLYAGKSGMKSKEALYLIESAKHLPEYEFVIVGVNAESKAYYSSFGLSNLTLFPFQKVESYENIIRAADILVGYYRDSEYNRHYLGPGKTSSYFKSKNPVIYSDLPSLRDRYTDDMVYFVKPDDPKLLIDKIKFVVNNPDISKDKANHAYNHVIEHTYEKSKSKILADIERREKEK